MVWRIYDIEAEAIPGLDTQEALVGFGLLIGFVDNNKRIK